MPRSQCIWCRRSAGFAGWQKGNTMSRLKIIHKRLFLLHLIRNTNAFIVATSVVMGLLCLIHVLHAVKSKMYIIPQSQDMFCRELAVFASWFFVVIARNYNIEGLSIYTLLHCILDKKLEGIWSRQFAAFASCQKRHTMARHENSHTHTLLFSTHKKTNAPKSWHLMS